MTRGPLTEDTVRVHLHGALEELSPAPRPFAELRRAVVRRRRQRQVAAIVGAGVLAGAGVSAGLAATGGSGPGRGATVIPQSPVDPVPALHDYVNAQGGASATGVLRGADRGTYAADIEAGKVHVLSFDGQTWSSVAELGSPLAGPPVVAVHRGPDGAGSAVAFQVDEAGGDAVFNGIVVDAGGGWRYADFDCGATRVACAGQGDKAAQYVTDGTEVDHVFHSEPNDCIPNCVAGTRYDVTWRWDQSSGFFGVQSAVKVH